MKAGGEQNRQVLVAALYFTQDRLTLRHFGSFLYQNNKTTSCWQLCVLYIHVLKTLYSQKFVDTGPSHLYELVGHPRQRPRFNKEFTLCGRMRVPINLKKVFSRVEIWASCRSVNFL